jgi:hypothetical protein
MKNFHSIQVFTDNTGVHEKQIVEKSCKIKGFQDRPAGAACLEWHGKCSPSTRFFDHLEAKE